MTHVVDFMSLLSKENKNKTHIYIYIYMAEIEKKGLI